jgi:cytochrome b561
MQWKNTTTAYGKGAQTLHWLMAIVIIAACVIAEIMLDMPKGEEKWALFDLHKSLGVVALLLIMIRFPWRWLNTIPTALGKLWQNKAAHIVHILLYVLMFLLPISGLMMSWSGGYEVDFFGLFTLPHLIGKNEMLHEIAEGIHHLGALALYILVAGHIAAAFYHQLILRDSVMKRMFISN